RSRTWVVDSFYRQITPLVENVDNFVNNRRLCSIFEANCLDGKLLVCSMDLWHEDKDSPEKKQLLYSLLNYMNSEAFAPVPTVAFDRIRSLVVSGEK
ncbi:MAG: glycoside hydrolase family 2, partial [Odoribacter splanchnicus]|nr:glycoside hydrolase family 2 [Odoribacter splanchnicus]